MIKKEIGKITIEERERRNERARDGEMEWSRGRKGTIDKDDGKKGK